MTNDQRIQRIEIKRAELKQAIADERARPFPDDLALRRMKTANCRMKDELAMLAAPERVAGASAA